MDAASRIDSYGHAAEARTSVMRGDETRVLIKKDETHVLINCVLINCQRGHLDFPSSFPKATTAVDNVEDDVIRQRSSSSGRPI